jgi:hypothetical protein
MFIPVGLGHRAAIRTNLTVVAVVACPVEKTPIRTVTPSFDMPGVPHALNTFLVFSITYPP